MFGGRQIHVRKRQFEVDIGNMHLLDLAMEAKKGVEETEQANPFIFNTIGVSDAIAMGTDGMRSSLPSRDLIADSIECAIRGQLYDANISLVPTYLSGLILAWMRQEHGMSALNLLNQARLSHGHGPRESAFNYGLRRSNNARTYNVT